MVMKRDDFLRVVAKNLSGDEIVVPIYTACFDWEVIRPSPLNYTSTGAMGLGSSHALGLAIGYPERKVVLFDGDGSLLMNLGTLVTIGAVAPRNYFHFLINNRAYESNGNQPLPQPDLDFAGIAETAGYRKVYRFNDLAVFEQQAAAILDEEGPVFVEAKLEAGMRSPRNRAVLYGPERRDIFRKAVAQG